MKMVIPGGSGQLGRMIQTALHAAGHQAVVLTRHPTQPTDVRWDGEVLDSWTKEIDGADIVLNLAGRTVNCRYTPKNLNQMLMSRTNSTEVIGQAIGLAKKPPPLWLQMSTATIYAHRFDKPNDEETGLIGGNEKDVPKYWKQSIDIAQAWENKLTHANTPNTRKIALRTAMVMAPSKGGVFEVLYHLTKLGLGGAIGGGQQYISWIHAHDFIDALHFIANNEKLEGPIILASPNAIPQKEFQQILRSAAKISLGLPATKWMAEVGAFILRTDTELLLKSRRVYPQRLISAGFNFRFPDWNSAAIDLVNRSKAHNYDFIWKSDS